MPYSVLFYPGDAFHADNVHQWSHGCIQLKWDDAEAFFNALKVALKRLPRAPKGLGKVVSRGLA